MSGGEWVDFKTIRAEVSIEQVLGYLGVTNLRREGSSLVGSCPIHGGNNPRAFRVEPAKNAWYCFTGCKRGGNQLDLVVAVRDITVRNAALELKREFLDKPPENRPPVERPWSQSDESDGAAASPEPATAPRAANTNSESEPRPNPVLDVSLNLRADYPYLGERGIDVATAEHFGVGYCSRGIMRGTVAIPVHNPSGGLVAYAGRRLKPQDVREHGKYKFPKGFRRELELYNWHRAAPEIARLGYAIIVEGFFTAMLLTSRGFGNTVAAMGSSLSEAQARIVSAAPEAVLLFDGDDAGRLGAERAQQRLEPHLTCHRIDLPTGLEPESLSDGALNWALRGVLEFWFSRLSLEFDGEEESDSPEI